MKAIACALAAALMVSTSVLAGDIRTERVHFEKGATSATVESSIKGYEGVDYVLGARKGQHMNASMATDNTANYFNILAPGKDDEVSIPGHSGHLFRSKADTDSD